MDITVRQPLFLVTGASCAGKTTTCNVLFQREKDYIVLESDVLWNDFFNTPQDDYRLYRSMWMNMCAHISQIGLPCVLCGCCTPQQFERLPERNLFTDVHYLVVVCNAETLHDRMTQGRRVL